MDSNKIFSKLKELGHTNSKREELREFCKLNIDKILKLLPARVAGGDGAEVLDCLLEGLPDSCPTMQQHRVKVVHIALERMGAEQTSLAVCGQVVSRVRLELGRLPTAELVAIVQRCLDAIADNTDINMTWRDMLPECVRVCGALPRVGAHGGELAGAQWRANTVLALLQTRWPADCLVPLAAMLKDIELSKCEHRQAVTRLSAAMLECSPDSLPPLLHQLLKLCERQHVELVLSHVSQYFDARLYRQLAPAPAPATQHDSDSTNLTNVDLDECGGGGEELRACLATCLYHVAAAGAAAEACARALRSWPRAALLRPALVGAALALADAPHASAALDTVQTLKAAIRQALVEAAERRGSAWLRDVLPPCADPAHILKALIVDSSGHRQLLIRGLIRLAFSLLAVSPPLGRERDEATSRCWALGSMVLARVVRAQPETAPHVLAQLADKLARADAPPHPQYAECVYTLCKACGMTVERCRGLAALAEGAGAGAGAGAPLAAERTLRALRPLLAYSTRLRDTLVMLCRKGLFSRELGVKSVALAGFLLVLRHVRAGAACAGAALSQASGDQSSAHSYLTQISIELHATHAGATVKSRVQNEAVCMEVVSILRRCLHQPAPIKSLLYTRLYASAKEKAVVQEPILELLHEHLTKYLSDKDDAVPLKFADCVHVTSSGPAITEPLGALLFCIAQFVERGVEQGQGEDEEETLGSQQQPALRGRLALLLESISDRLAACTLQHFHMDGEPGVGEAGEEGCRVAVVLQCVEALLGWQVLRWGPRSPRAHAAFLRLLTLHQQLLDATKTSTKQNKKKSPKDGDTTTQKSQRSQKGKGKGKGTGREKVTLRALRALKDRTPPFKPLPCVWDLQLCHKMVQLLYDEEVPWCSVEGRAAVRGKRAVHVHVLRAVRAVLAAQHASTADKHEVGAHAAAVAATLYQRTLLRFEEMCEFDEQCALEALETFSASLRLLLDRELNLDRDAVLQKVVGVSEGGAGVAAARLLQAARRGLALVQAELSELPAAVDAASRRLLDAWQALAVHALSLPLTASPPPELVQAESEMEEAVCASERECVCVVAALLAARARHAHDAPLLDELLDKMAAVLGHIDDEASVVEGTQDVGARLRWMDEGSAQRTLAAVCAHVQARGAHVALGVQRARQLHAALGHAPAARRDAMERELTELDKSIIVACCALSARTGRAVSLRCSAGAASERALLAAVRLYGVLRAALEHAAALAATHPDTLAQAHTLRLEKLVKLGGRRFSSLIDNLITYLESSQGHQPAAAKILKETRLIPKLVFEAEKFCKQVMQLSNKMKINFVQHLSLGTARDFRIQAPVLHDVITGQNQHNEPDIDNDDVTDPNDEELDMVDADAATEVLSARSHADDDDDEGLEDERTDDDERPAATKRRRYS